MPTLILFIAASLLLSVAPASLLAFTRLRWPTAWLAAVIPASPGVIGWSLSEVARVRSAPLGGMITVTGNTDAGTRSLTHLLPFSAAWLGLVWLAGLAPLVAIRLVKHAARAFTRAPHPSGPTL